MDEAALNRPHGGSRTVGPHFRTRLRRSTAVWLVLSTRGRASEHTVVARSIPGDWRLILQKYPGAATLPLIVSAAVSYENMAALTRFEPV